MIEREELQGRADALAGAGLAARVERSLAGARLPLAVAVIALLAGLAAWRPAPLGIWHDDGVYGQLGRALAAGHGYHLDGVPGSPAAARFPPVYPAVLAPLWRLAPSPAAFARLAVGLNLLLLALAAGAFASYVRDRLGLGAAAAAIAAIGGWLHLQLWYTAFVPLSEPLFVLLLVLALARLARLEGAAAREPAVGRADGRTAAATAPRGLVRGWVPLVVLLLLIVHTRSIGVAFVAGAVIGIAVRRGVVRGGAVALATGAGMLPWWWWSGRATAALPLPLRDMLGGYQDWLGARIAADPGGFMTSLGGSVGHLVTALTRALFPSLPGLLLPVLAPVALVAVAAGLWLLGRRSPGAAWGLAAYLAIVIVWPFPDLRLVAAVAPLLILCAVLAIDAALRAARRRPAAFADAVRALAMVWLVGYALSAGARLLNPASTQMQAVRSRQLEWVMAAIAQVTEPRAVIGAPELWPAIPLHTGRLGAPSAPFRPGATDRPVWGLPEDQYRVWAAAGIGYLVTEDGRRVHGAALDRLDAACPGALAVLAFWEGVALVRLGWDESCRARLGVPQH